MGFDVVAMGELLVDFTPVGKSEQDNPVFEANPGGAPCNVLAMLSRLGHRTAFIGKVGADVHGRRLASVVKEAGIDISGLVLSCDVDTTLAFVTLNDEGDREFSFFRRPGADTMISASEIPVESLNDTKIFHFGSLSLTHEPSRSATVKAVRVAQKAGACISYDPNYRPALWGSIEDAKEQMLWGCAQCDVLKIAQEELDFLTGTDSAEKGVKYLRDHFSNIKMILLTDGKNGSHAYWRGSFVACPTFLNVKTVDTTGAGDTFMGCCLHYILCNGLDQWNDKNLEEMLRYANAAASLITTKRGALLSMPSITEITRLLSDNL